MTENPVGVSPGACRKARGCPGPLPSLQTVPKPTNPKPISPVLNGPAHTVVGHSGPGHTVVGHSGPGYTGPCSGLSSPSPKGGTGTCRPIGDLEEDNIVCRRKCGCMLTSDKLKQILQTFPNPQPPGGYQAYMAKKYDKASGYAYGQSGKSCCPTEEEHSENTSNDKLDPCHRCMLHRRRMRQAEALTELHGASKQHLSKHQREATEGKTTSRTWQIVSELVSLVQLSVTATALALYYLIYCYMQLVYYTLRSALYFHNADGPMKITIGVVMLTSLIVGFNILMRMEGIIGIVY